MNDIAHISIKTLKPLKYDSYSENFHDYRGYAGRVSGGTFRVGDDITVLPSKTQSKIIAIDEGTKSLSEAFTPQSVTIRLSDNVDISRGDLLVKTNELQPTVNANVSLLVCWLNHRPLNEGGKYIVRHGTDETRAIIKNVHYKVGETVYPDSFDEDRWNECSNGIHFFMTRREAELY